MCYLIQSSISHWLPLNFTVTLLTTERHPLKQWHRADSLHHPGERSTPPYLELTAFQACLDDGKWMPGYHEQYPCQSLLPLENLKTVTQNKRGKKSYFCHRFYSSKKTIILASTYFSPRLCHHCGFKRISYSTTSISTKNGIVKFQQKWNHPILNAEQ